MYVTPCRLDIGKLYASESYTMWFAGFALTGAAVMASITKEILVAAPPEHAWAMIRDFGGVQRLVPGFLVDCHLDGDARVVTFASGRVARELLVDIDDVARRLVYAEPNGPFLTRSASLQVFADGADRCRVVWIIDVLPNEFAGLMRDNMQKASALMEQTLENRSG
jgi:carbon monoxide dehydrogenase subunit G